MNAEETHRGLKNYTNFLAVIILILVIYALERVEMAFLLKAAVALGMIWLLFSLESRIRHEALAARLAAWRVKTGYLYAITLVLFFVCGMLLLK